MINNYVSIPLLITHSVNGPALGNKIQFYCMVRNHWVRVTFFRISKRHLGMTLGRDDVRTYMSCSCSYPLLHAHPTCQEIIIFISWLYFCGGLMGRLPLAQRRTNPPSEPLLFFHRTFSMKVIAFDSECRWLGELLGWWVSLELSYIDYRLWSPGFYIMITRYFQTEGDLPKI